MDVRDIETFLLHGVETPLSTADRALLDHAATNPDMYMPFKVHAPSAQRLRQLFTEQPPNVLLTDLGFRNLVATRYISYNSRFLLSGEQKYALHVQDLLSCFNRKPKRPTDYFLSGKIYGNNHTRFLDRLEDVWDHSFWPVELGRSFIAVWRVLSLGIEKDDKKYKIPNIGVLLALQICSKPLCCLSIDKH